MVAYCLFVKFDSSLEMEVVLQNDDFHKFPYKLKLNLSILLKSYG